MNPPDPKALAAALVELGMSAPFASQVANRKRRPSLAWAVKIERALGIPCAFWTEEKEQ